jgi:uncharacterized glyoxalase superfamily protein PhnB
LTPVQTANIVASDCGLRIEKPLTAVNPQSAMKGDQRMAKKAKAPKGKPAAKAKTAGKGKAPPPKAAAKAKPAPAAKPAAKPAAPPRPAAASAARKGIPEGRHSITPHLVVRGVPHAIDFYRRAFGAEEVMRMPSPDGSAVMHAEIKIGNSLVYLADEMPEAGDRKAPPSLNGTTGSVHLYVDNVDAVFKQAVDNGARVLMPVADMFWGDRFGMIADPFGHHWSIATHKETLTPQEMGKRAEKFFQQMPKPPG